MAKMLRLVQNEYIKTWKKVSTKIIFILVFVCAFGLIGIAKIAEFAMEEEMQYLYTDSETDYSYDIQEAEKMKYDGYENDIEMYKFLTDNKLSHGDWKYNAAYTAFEYEVLEDGTVKYTYPDEARKELLDCIRNNDWKKYCEGLIKSMKAMGLPEAQYWEYQYRIDKNIPLPTSFEESWSWPNDVIDSVAYSKLALSETEEVTAESASEKKKSEDNITLGLYRLENDIELNVADNTSLLNAFSGVNFWLVFCQSASLISVIGLLIIVITGSTIANEFSQGTIKFLLINPVKRWKILISKYIMSISLGFIMILLLYGASAVLSMIFFGTEHLNAEYLKVVDGAVQGTNGFVYVFRNYMLRSVQVVVMATLAFAISSLVKSSSLAIGISLFAMLSGNTVVSILKSGLKQDWARYLIFANTDLAAVADGTTGFAHHSMGFAVAVILIHLFVFMLIAWDGFTKREV